ncbi:MAG: hypothetical protein ACAH65_07050, partial [Chloroflexota bacterium]
EAGLLLLDAADVDGLLSRAGPAIGSGRGPADGLRGARRAADTASWAVLGAASIGLLGLVTLRVGQSLAARANEGDLGPEILARTALFVLACLGLIVVARQVAIALLDRRRRKRRSATLRLVRQLSSTAGSGRSRPAETASLGVLSGVAAVTVFVASVGAWDLPRTPADGVLAQPSSEAGSGIPSLGGGAGSPVGTERAEPTRSSEPAVAETAGPSPTLSESVGGPSPTTVPPVQPAPIATPTPTPTPEATPTPTPVATPPPPPPSDDDGDGVETVFETKYGSDPYDAASTPEDANYDVSFATNTCSDLKDNDIDTLIDDKDPGCAIVP